MRLLSYLKVAAITSTITSTITTVEPFMLNRIKSVTRLTQPNLVRDFSLVKSVSNVNGRSVGTARCTARCRNVLKAKKKIEVRDGK